jgi:ComF family protein
MKMVGQFHPLYTSYHFLWKTLDWLFPLVYGGCGHPGICWCQKCQDEVIPLVNHSCPFCAHPQPDASFCVICSKHPPALHSLQAFAVYTGSFRKAVQNIKYQHDIGLAEELSVRLAELYRSHLRWDIDLVTTAPLSEERHFERGYNQSHTIAFPFSLAIRKQFSPHTFKRVRNTSSHVGLSKRERMNNIKNAFSISKIDPQGNNILIIDALITTGSTLNEYASVLRSAGALNGYGLKLAKTSFKESFNE